MSDSDNGPMGDPPPAATPPATIPHPRMTVNTRRQTAAYGKLMTDKTKEDLLNHPSIASSIISVAQAKKHLTERGLIKAGQDPDHSSLCLALLNVAYTAPGITAIAADAIRSAAILIDSLPSGPSPSPPPNSSPQTDTLSIALENQVNSLKECMKEIHRMTEINKTSAKALARTVEETRNELHGVAQYVSDTADELTGLPNQIKEAITAIPAPSPQQNSPSTSYRNVLITKTPSSRPDLNAHNHCPDVSRANAAIKERQILLDIGPDHPTINKETPRNEIVTLIQKALTNLQNPSGPTLRAKALIHLRNGGYIIEMASAEAAAWVRDPIRKMILTESLGGNVRIKDRTYNVLVPFIPITARVDDEQTLRDIEKTNDIPPNSITQMKWIKDPQRRGRNQRVAHALMSLNNPKAANKLIESGMYFDYGRLRPYKDKKEPLRCLKCQRWGHMAKNCTEEKDTCGTCAGEHRHSKCNSYRTYFCISCKSSSHSSSDKECPEYKTQLEALNAHIPENSMPYFPTEEPWTQVSLPPKPKGPIIQTQPPADKTTMEHDPTDLQQRTIEWTIQRRAPGPQQPPSAPVVNGRTLVPLGHSKPKRMPTPPSPVNPNSTPSESLPPTPPIDNPNSPPATESGLRTHPDPFPALSPLHFPGNLPSTPPRSHEQPTQQENPPSSSSLP